jgi:5-methylthioadenosine/S-adenosylhomocysteine deaminase
VWVDEADQRLLGERGVHVLHCPGSNLKLGSGIAPILELKARGVSLSLGADGAACNNRLDMFDEMRLAATLQSMRHGPGALPAAEVLWMATRGGAAALGLADQIGSLEPGKRADLIIVSRERPHLQPDRNPYSTLVYAARGTDVRLTLVDGEILVDDFALTRVDEDELAHDARRAAAELAARARIR